MILAGPFMFDPRAFWARAYWRLSRLWGGGHPGDEPWDVVEDGEMIDPGGEITPITVSHMVVAEDGDSRSPT